jgi:hypothetical protein
VPGSGAAVVPAAAAGADAFSSLDEEEEEQQPNAHTFSPVREVAQGGELVLPRWLGVLIAFPIIQMTMIRSGALARWASGVKSFCVVELQLTDLMTPTVRWLALMLSNAWLVVCNCHLRLNPLPRPTPLGMTTVTPRV